MLFDRFSQSFLEAYPIWILKESKYVRLASTIYRVLRNSRIPMFLHRKSNYIFTTWQHLVVLLTIRQYEGKSYRMFAEWLFEAYYLRMFLQVSHTPHSTTTLQKFSSRINKWYAIGDDNFLIHIITWQYQKNKYLLE
jgi:hypothetical protein